MMVKEKILAIVLGLSAIGAPMITSVPAVASSSTVRVTRSPKYRNGNTVQWRDEARNSSGKVIYYTSYYQYGNHGTWHRAYSNGTEQYGRFWLDSNGRMHEEVTRKSMTKGKTRSINNSRKGIYQ